jgi:pyruvate/2-oxoglutarate dehydrogenase complex dihydrolipoamide acyltransferase (E2) component
MSAADITLGTLGGEYMESAVLVEWRVADGAQVSAGDVVAVVETAKAATEIEAPGGGVLRILVPAGDEIAVGTVLARLGEDAPAMPAAPTALTAPSEHRHAHAPAPQAARAGLPRRWPDAYASPLAKRVAVARGVDLRHVRGSGPGGRIVRADVPDAARATAEAPYRIALDLDAQALNEARARRWDAGERPAIGALVAAAASDALRAIGRAWPVAHLEDATPPTDALAIIDLTGFGIAEFVPPQLPCRAVLGLSVPRAGALRLSLAADARELACTDAARFLATLRAALESLADA